MEDAIFNFLRSQLLEVLPEGVQVLRLYEKTERNGDIVKIGVSPAGVHAIGTPYRECNITLAAGVRREHPEPEKRLMEVYAPIRNWLRSGYTTVTAVTGGQIDAVLPRQGEAAEMGTDDTEVYLLAVTTGKVYFTVQTQNT